MLTFKFIQVFFAITFVKYSVRYQVSSGNVGSHENFLSIYNPDSMVHGANMGPTWFMSTTDGPHVDPMNLAIWYGWSLDDDNAQRLELESVWC